VPRQPHELFVAGVALIVDADDACARAGLPSGPANQQPVSSIQITGAEVEARTPYSIR